MNFCSDVRRWICNAFFLFGGISFVFAQPDSIPANCDCPKSKEISPLDIYRAPIAPYGQGEIVEYSNEDPFSLYYFENEHNTAWYTFAFPTNGTLAFDIVPDSLRDDYDFILYKYKGPDFCKAVKEKKIQPLRTCISRNDKSIRSWTGLKESASDEYIHSGPGPSYALPVHVRKGERYVLVLDNVYPNGGTHTIIWHFDVPVNVYGKIKEDSTYNPLKAKVRIVDNETGKVVAETWTDPHTGEFDIKVELDYTHTYDIFTSSEGHFIDYYTLDPKKANHRTMEYRAELPTLAEDKTFTLEGINFEPNVDVLVPEAEPKAQHLLGFMLEFPKARIRIEGHTNCAGNMYGPTVKDQPLSEARARKIYNILMDGGVHPSRMEQKGWGCSRMIAPRATVLEDQKRNMRVEIRVLEY